MIAAIMIVVLSGRNDLNVFAAIAVILLVSLLSVGKSWLRLRAVELVLFERWPVIRRQRFTQNTLWALSPALFFINSVAALLSRRMTWRGIRYELKSPTVTLIAWGDSAEKAGRTRGSQLGRDKTGN